jgi:hypothetical protein
MLLLFFAIVLPLFNVVSATTYVGNTLNGNTVWTVANSPYSLTADLVIYSGETLNIQPGVVVNLRGYQIQVYGALNAQGSNSDKVYFLNNGLSSSQIIFKYSSASCIIDYGVFYSVPITIEGSSSKLSNSYFTGTSSTAVITVNAGDVSIMNNVISTQNVQNGIHINAGYVTIVGNTISGARAQQGCGIFNTGSTASITANKIANFYTGIYTNKPCVIEQNIITNNINDGIVAESTSAVTIRHNAITYNMVGVSRDANIQNNTISYNTYGLWGQTSSSTIQFNNIIDNNSESIHLTETAANVNAISNWWGTTNEQTIRATISDYDPNLRPNLGVVTFTPFLTSPAICQVSPQNVVVPTPPPTPTITNTPSPTLNTTLSPPQLTDTYPPYTPYPPDNSDQDNPFTPSTNEPGFGGFTLTDITTAVVIVVAVSVAIAIIVVINRLPSKHRQDVNGNTQRLFQIFL